MKYTNLQYNGNKKRHFEYRSKQNKDIQTEK